MRKKTILVLILACCSTLVCNAQQVLNSTGNSISGNNLLIEYSIGEVATATTGTLGAGNHLTAGVIQPNYSIVNDVSDLLSDSYNLKAFPNPTTNQLTIETDFEDFTNYRFTNQLGQTLSSGRFDYSPLDLYWMPQGTYYLMLTSKSEQIFKTIKIIKQ